MSCSDSENEIGVPRRRRSVLQLPVAGQNSTPGSSVHSADSDDDDNFHTLFKRKRINKLKTVQNNATFSASSDDDDNDVQSSNMQSDKRRRGRRNVSSPAPVRDSGEHLPELFQNKDIFEADSDGSDKALGRDSLNGPGSNCSSPVVKEGKLPPKGVKAHKKERKHLHSETQKIVRESSIQLPAYQPKKKSLSDFLSKLNSSRPQARPKETVVAERPASPQPQGKVPSVGGAGGVAVAESFQNRFLSQLKSAAAECPVKEDSSGLSWQQLKASLQTSLAKQRAEEVVQIKQMKRFEEDETMDWEEEAGEADLTTDSGSDLEPPECPPGGVSPSGRSTPPSQHSRDGTEGETASIEGRGFETCGPCDGDSKGEGVSCDGDSKGENISCDGDWKGEGVSCDGGSKGEGVSCDEDSIGGENVPRSVKRMKKVCTIGSDDEDAPGQTGDTVNGLQRRLNFEGITASIGKEDSGFETVPVTVRESVSKSASLDTSPTKSHNSLSQDLFSGDSLQSDSVVFRQPVVMAMQPAPALLEEESVTQLLDTQGLLCMRKRKKKSDVPSALPSLVTSPFKPGSDNMQALLGLCSGQFIDHPATPPATPPAEEGGESSGSEAENPVAGGPSTQAMRELLGMTQPPQQPGGSSLAKLFQSSSQNGSTSLSTDLLRLCSGKFPSGKSASQPSGKFPFQLSGDFPSQSFGKLPSQPSVEVSDDDDDDEMPVLRRSIPALTRPSKDERLAEFVEAEAELSGSDVGSGDEEDEAGSELDQYEVDGGGSDVPDSDSELQKQVTRVHMRGVMADDKNELKEIKERFLAEGDLHEDGMYLRNGLFRKRRLAQRQGSSLESLDLFPEESPLDSGGEEVEGDSDDAAEVTRRRRRLERDSFLKFMRANRGSLLEDDEDSLSVLSVLSCDAGTPTTALRGRGGGEGRPQRLTPQAPCGSFIRRSHSQLKRLASATSRAPAAGGEGQKGVFFKVEAPADTKEARKPSGAPKVAQQPAKKKPRLSAQADNFSEDSNSVFDILTYV